MYFGPSQTRLLLRVREMVHRGELTERGLARATGISQPHVHNMLKGARAFSQEFADQLLHHLGLTLADLLRDPEEASGHGGLHTFQPVPVLRGRTGARNFPFTPERHESVHPFPRAQVSGLTDPVVLTLAADKAMAPRFQEGDLALLERAEHARLHPEPKSSYIVDTGEGTAVRYIRSGGRSLYLLTEDSMKDPRRWDYLSLAGRNILDVVRGRIVWIGRALEANPAEQARKFG
jgi:hypothetical protein